MARCLDNGYAGSWDSVHSLAKIRQGGFYGQIPYLAERMTAAARPIEHDKLVQRLTALGMTMAANRAPAEASIWLHETARLLRDLAEDVVCDAIDQCQLKMKFLPTVAEIREIADPVMEQRRKDAARLEAMARLIASGAVIPELPKPAPPKPREPDKPMTAAEIDEMNAIMARIGAATRYHPDGSRYEVERGGPKAQPRGPLRNPTRQDYINMGVDPALLDQLKDEAA